ncbi:MAG: hypothetical protein KAY96_03175 [Bacteroidia bacterium]|nr:hypothetical protein [Bacteroidia bacterium]MBP8073738.1 hypothetical protein [Bacteroidia bacterium]
MKRRLLSAPLAFMLMLASVFSFSGCLVETCHDCNTPPPCTWGPNGAPGPAFFGLDWTGYSAPTYVWTNNTGIPPTFQYGTYYNSLPGNYHLYYEGRFIDGCCYTEYFWEVDFVVWVNVGTAGGCGYAGLNGLPSYLMIVCGPNGPGNIRTNKLAEQGIEMTILSENANEVIVQYVKGDINVRITYHRLAESQKRLLDASGVVTAVASSK